MNSSRFAGLRSVCLALFAPFVLATLAPAAHAARSETRNFIVHAPRQDMADEIGRAAEHFRRELSLEWTGQAMPPWGAKCPIKVKIADGAGGATTFSFANGEVFGWKMEIQGSMQRILDSVLPHEVSHTIFACHFRRPLPRWADEGAATLVEHESERRRQTRLLAGVIRTSKRIPLSQLLSMTEYPRDQRDVLTLYAEGYSLADLLVQEQGKATYLRFLDDADRRGWAAALNEHYGYASIAALEGRWHSWVMAGSPPVDQPAADGSLLAGGDAIQPGQFSGQLAMTAPNGPRGGASLTSPVGRPARSRNSSGTNWTSTPSGTQIAAALPPSPPSQPSTSRPAARPQPIGARGQMPDAAPNTARSTASNTAPNTTPDTGLSLGPATDFATGQPAPSREDWGQSKFDRAAAAAVAAERDARGLPPITRTVAAPESPDERSRDDRLTAGGKLSRRGIRQPVLRKRRDAFAGQSTDETF